MLFQLNKMKYVSQLRVANGSRVNILLDTGSVYTVLSIRAVCVLWRKAVDNEQVLQFLRGSDCIVCKSFSGNDVRLVPVTLRNVMLGGTSIDTLQCFVNCSDTTATSLFGMDMISACTFTQMCNGLELYLRDSVIAYSNFKELCQGVTPYEIMNLERDIKCLEAGVLTEKKYDGQRLTASQLLKNLEG